MNEERAHSRHLGEQEAPNVRQHRILKQRISGQIKASEERCIAYQELRRQATDLWR
jgi:hypothetical protein